MTEFGGQCWRVTLPDGWVGEHDLECDSIYHPEGVGALQISVARKEGVVTDDDLRDFAAEHIESGAKTRDVRSGNLSGFTFSYSVENEFWRHWYLKSESLALFVTYNCDIENKGIEDEVVDLILDSLRLK